MSDCHNIPKLGSRTQSPELPETTEDKIDESNQITYLTDRIEALEVEERELNNNNRTAITRIRQIAQAVTCLCAAITIIKLYRNVSLIERECSTYESGCDFPIHCASAVGTYMQLRKLYTTNTTNFSESEMALFSQSVTFATRLLEYDLRDTWNSATNFIKVISTIPEASKWLVWTLYSLIATIITTLILGKK